MYLQKPPLGTQLDWNNHLNKGVVMHLAMNEGHGDKVQDLSMNGNHGTLNNVAIPPTVDSGWNPGQTGVGLKFDGTDDYIDCGTATSLDITGELTYSFITKQLPGTTGYPIIFNTNTDTKRLYGVFFDGVKIYLNYFDGAKKTVNWDFVYNDGIFHSYIAVMSGVDINLFIDGISQGAQTMDGAFQTDASAYLSIGKRLSNSGFFTGAIDQVRILNRALSAKEVMDYYINPWQVYLDEDD